MREHIKLPMQRHSIRLKAILLAWALSGPNVALAGAPPANDLCQDAAGVSIPSVTGGSTITASEDSALAPTCGTEVTARGVWYTVVGTGTTITASTCVAEGGSATYDNKLSAYCGSCGGLMCVTGRDDFCGLQSQISWCAAAGTTYRILVHGFSSAAGTFNLSLSENGTPCTPTVECAAAAPHPAPAVSSLGLALVIVTLAGVGAVALTRPRRRA